MVRIKVQGEPYSSSFLCWINSQKIIGFLLNINFSFICFIIENVCTKKSSESTQQEPSSIINIASVGRTCPKAVLARWARQAQDGRRGCNHHCSFGGRSAGVTWLGLRRSVWPLCKLQLYLPSSCQCLCHKMPVLCHSCWVSPVQQNEGGICKLKRRLTVQELMCTRGFWHAW